MATPTYCMTCQFWAAPEDSEKDDISVDGQCLRWAPAPIMAPPDQEFIVHWPTTDAVEWCGEWRELELAERQSRIRELGPRIKGPLIASVVEDLDHTWQLQ